MILRQFLKSKNFLINTHACKKNIKKSAAALEQAEYNGVQIAVFIFDGLNKK
jgi:hypothetical protein